MTLFSKSDYKVLNAASGYAQLGLFEEAKEELNQLSSACSQEHRVLSLKIWIYQELEEWENVMELAKHLANTDSDNPDWFIAWAYATRRAKSIEEAQKILQEAIIQLYKGSLTCSE